MTEYRNDKITEQMIRIEKLLTSISEKQAKNLGVVEVMQEDHLLSYDDAIRKAMMKKANEAMIQAKTLATGFDRVIAMVGQMAHELEQHDVKKASLYRNRLNVLTNFVRISQEFEPAEANKFAHI
jgi:rRNA pseudouridine-1189 N-methylase Emg1 (Nep1/Mra1 family)